ncbi:MAG: hypothetical protein ACKPKT_06060 [Dolichospermum sp.]
MHLSELDCYNNTIAKKKQLPYILVNPAGKGFRLSATACQANTILHF